MSIQPLRTQTAGPFTMAGLRHRYTDETRAEIPALWGHLCQYLDSIPNQVGHGTYGILWNAWTGSGGPFDYMCGVAVSSTDGLDGNLQTLEIPERTYLVFEHIGSLQFLCDTIDAIFNHWLPASGHKLASLPEYLEVYGDEFEPEIASGRIELWVAVQ